MCIGHFFLVYVNISFSLLLVISVPVLLLIIDTRSVYFFPDFSWVLILVFLHIFSFFCASLNWQMLSVFMCKSYILLYVFSMPQHAERAMCYCKSVHLSVCPSHGWISRKWLNLGSCNFHHTVTPSLSCLRYKFHPEIPTGSPRVGRQTRAGWENELILLVF